MRFAKTLVLVIAATALMGSSQAMAEDTALCTLDPESLRPLFFECLQPAAVHLLSAEVTLEGEKEVSSDSPITILNPLTNVKCELLLQGMLQEQLGTPVRVTVEPGGLVFTKCSGGCTVGATEGGTLLFLKQGLEHALVEIDGITTSVSCMFFKCTFSWKGTLGDFLGALIPDTGETGHLRFVEQPLEGAGGFLCTKAKLDALLQSLKPIHIRS